MSLPDFPSSPVLKVNQTSNISDLKPDSTSKPTSKPPNLNGASPNFSISSSMIFALELPLKTQEFFSSFGNIDSYTESLTKYQISSLKEVLKTCSISTINQNILVTVSQSQKVSPAISYILDKVDNAYNYGNCVEYEIIPSDQHPLTLQYVARQFGPILDRYSNVIVHFSFSPRDGAKLIVQHQISTVMCFLLRSMFLNTPIDDLLDDIPVPSNLIPKQRLACSYPMFKDPFPFSYVSNPKCRVAGSQAWWRVKQSLLLKINTSVTNSCYVYCKSEINLQLNKLKLLQQQRAVDRIYFAVKSNPCPSVLKTVQQSGIGFEIVTLGEFEHLTHAIPSLDLARILYSPASGSLTDYKTVLDLQTPLPESIILKIQEGIDPFGDRKSFEDWYTVHDKTYGPNIIIGSIHPLQLFPSCFRGRRIILRIDPPPNHPLVHVHGHHDHVHTAGSLSKFGISASQLPEIRKICKAIGCMVVGFHSHCASNVKHTQTWAQISRFLKSIIKTANIVQFPYIRYLDLGGGLGVPGNPGENCLDLNLVAQSLLHSKTLSITSPFKENQTKNSPVKTNPNLPTIPSSRKTGLSYSQSPGLQINKKSPKSLNKSESPSSSTMNLKVLDQNVISSYVTPPKEYTWNLEHWIEPGRFIVAQAGVLLTTVRQIKSKPNSFSLSGPQKTNCFPHLHWHGSSRHFFSVDTGMNALIRPSLYGANHYIENLSRPWTGKSTYKSAVLGDVVGPICETGDFFGHNVPLSISTSVEDTILIATCGAYGQSMSSSYNMVPTPYQFFIN